MFTESNSLTQLRELLGRLHGSKTSTAIRDFPVVEANARGFYQYTRLATTILRETLFEASYAFVHTDGQLTKARLSKMGTSLEAFAFICGTGLEVMLEEYGLDYNADAIREFFYQRFNIKEP